MVPVSVFPDIKDLNSKGKENYRCEHCQYIVSGHRTVFEYSIGKGTRLKVKILIRQKRKIQEDIATGRVDWQSRFKKMYLIGIFFDEELNMEKQPKLIGHLTWLIDTYKWPQPYKDQRIVML